jgi:hypothetical protein
MPLPMTGNGWIFCAAEFPSSCASGVKVFVVSLLCDLFKKICLKKKNGKKKAQNKRPSAGRHQMERGIKDGNE